MNRSSGSSPRGRGTHIPQADRHRHQRFIPAWAGNTYRFRSVSSGPPVHPRVGGEHDEIQRLRIRLVGSSPRGRGTRLAGLLVYPVCRFIPAWAGNTRMLPGSVIGVPVHPRVGGEHISQPSQRIDFIGSSPRGRGTLNDVRKAKSDQRFIPAWAGNTSRNARHCAHTPVHPRVGGEHKSKRPPLCAYTGSSPRGRGTPYNKL